MARTMGLAVLDGRSAREIAEKGTPAEEELVTALEAFAEVQDVGNPGKFVNEAFAAVLDVLDGFGTVEDAREEGDAE